MGGIGRAPLFRVHASTCSGPGAWHVFRVRVGTCRGRVRGMARQVAEAYVAMRYRLGLPLCSEEERDVAMAAWREAEAKKAAAAAKRAAKQAKSKGEEAQASASGGAR